LTRADQLAEYSKATDGASFSSAVRKIHTHLFLVSDQLILNFTPVLDPHFCPKEVYLLASATMRSQTERLTRMLREKGLRVNQWPVDDSWNIQHLRERVLEFLVEHDGNEVALNSSGGTRPMSLAAYEVFRYANKPIYYVNPDNDHVVWLHPYDRGFFDLADRIRLPAYLATQDLRLVSTVRRGVNEHLQELTATLVRLVDRYSSPLAILNWYAAAASERNGMASPPLNPKHQKLSEFQELLNVFETHGVMHLDSRQRLIFADAAARFYVNGGWLEEHAFGEISKLRRELTTIQDLARNIVIEWDEKESPVKNELDVAFLANNQLYLIECKTKKFQKKPSFDSDIASSLYKLNTLRESFGGDRGKAMLVSYRVLKKSARQRATELGIEVCDGGDINMLRSRVREWVARNSLAIKEAISDE